MKITHTVQVNDDGTCKHFLNNQPYIPSTETLNTIRSEFGIKKLKCVECNITNEDGDKFYTSTIYTRCKKCLYKHRQRLKEAKKLRLKD